MPAAEGTACGNNMVCYRGYAGVVLKWDLLSNVNCDLVYDHALKRIVQFSKKCFYCW